MPISGLEREKQKRVKEMLCSIDWCRISDINGAIIDPILNAEGKLINDFKDAKQFKTNNDTIKIPGRPDLLSSIYIRNTYISLLEDILNKINTIKYFSICGSPGTGKTLLLYIIAYFMRLMYPGCSLIWLAGRDIYGENTLYYEIIISGTSKKRIYLCDDYILPAIDIAQGDLSFTAMSGLAVENLKSSALRTNYYMPPWSYDEVRDACLVLKYSKLLEREDSNNNNSQTHLKIRFDVVGPIARKLLSEPDNDHPALITGNFKTMYMNKLRSLDSSKLGEILVENIKRSETALDGVGSIIVISDSGSIFKPGSFEMASQFLALEVGKQCIITKQNKIAKFLEGDVTAAQTISSIGPELFETFATWCLFYGGIFNMATLLKNSRSKPIFKNFQMPCSCRSSDLTSASIEVCSSFKDAIEKFKKRDINFFKTIRGMALADAIFIAPNLDAHLESNQPVNKKPKLLKNQLSISSSAAVATRDTRKSYNVYFFNAYYHQSRNPFRDATGHSFTKEGSQEASDVFADDVDFKWNLFFVQAIPNSFCNLVTYPTDTKGCAQKVLDRFTMTKLLIDISQVPFK